VDLQVQKNMTEAGAATAAIAAVLADDGAKKSKA
jgi:hypothetical protein